MIDRAKEATERPGHDRSVAVVGGGLAGITAAAKLFSQGYKVTLFEKSGVLGGNFSSNSKDNNSKPRDVYPHIIGAWYREFQYLLEEDFSLDFDKLFAVRDKIKMAVLTDSKPKNFAEVRFEDLATPTSLENLLNNVRSEILSVKDMVLFGYTYLDLVSVPRRSQRLEVLDELDVTGYLFARPFMNEHIAKLHDDMLKVIWSMPSNQTSAKAYQDLIRHTLTFPKETPFARLLTGPAGKVLMGPITDKLKEGLGTQLRLNTEVETINVDPHGHHVEITTKAPDGGAPRTESFHYAIIATPSKFALKLAFSGNPKTSLMDYAPSLARLREATSGRIPVVYLYFTKEFIKKQGAGLAALPAELIGFKKLAQAREKEKTSRNLDYDISILDISKLWDKSDLGADDKEPVLVLAASRANAIPQLGPNEGATDGKREGLAMIKKLAEYFPFIGVGDAWNNSCDVDWERTHVITNQDYQLFLNDAGSESWRPGARVGQLKNVFFAGDYCRTDINMATVEAAVQSGVLAVQEVQGAEHDHELINLQPHDLYENSVFLFAKLCIMPLAFAVAVTEVYESALVSPFTTMMFPFSVAARGAAFGSDWVRTAIQFCQCFINEQERSPTGAGSYQGVAYHDNRVGLVQWAQNIVDALREEGPTLGPIIGDIVSKAVGGINQLAAPAHQRKSGGVRRPNPTRPVRSSAIAADPNETWAEYVHAFVLNDIVKGGTSDLAHALDALLKTTGAPPSGSSLSGGNDGSRYSAALRDTVAAGLATGVKARRREERGYRVYEKVRSL